MSNENVFGRADFSVEHAIKMIKTDNPKEIFNVIFDALKETVEKYKELKQFNLPIILEQQTNQSAPFYEAQIDFTEFLNIISIKSLQSKRFTDKEILFIQNFINKYFNDPSFALKLVDFGRNFIQQSKEKNIVTAVQLDTIARNFEVFPNTILEVKMLLEHIFRGIDINIKFIYTDEEKQIILESLRNKVDRENLSIKNKQLLKNKLEEDVKIYNFSEHISEEEIDTFFNYWFDNVYKKSFVNVEKINELLKKLKPYPDFSFEISTYKGPFKNFVNFIKSLFNIPIATLELTAYEGTKYKETLLDQNKHDIYEDNISLEMCRIANDVTKLLRITDNVLDDLSINDLVLKEHSIEKINIYQNYIMLKYEICDFIYQFFIDLKKIGLSMGKVKIKYFFTFLIKNLTKFKSVINTPLNNYFQTRESEINSDYHGNIKRKLNDINVELSGLYVNLSRLEDRELSNK